MTTKFKYQILDQKFKTKDASYKYCKNYIKEIGFKNITPDDEEYKFLSAMFRVLPDAFEIEKNKMCDSPHVNVIIDGISDARSWVKASRFIFTPSSHKTELNEAMRQAISKDTMSWKNRNRRYGKCRYCQCKEKLQVDHIVSFDSIKKDFLKDRKDIPTSFIQNKTDYTMNFKPEDKKFEVSWYAYHKSKAKFQFLCRECNGKKSNSEYHKEWLSKNKTNYNEYHKQYQAKKRARIKALKATQREEETSDSDLDSDSDSD